MLKAASQNAGMAGFRRSALLAALYNILFTLNSYFKYKYCNALSSVVKASANPKNNATLT